MIQPRGSYIVYRRLPQPEKVQKLIVRPDDYVYDNYECVVLAVGPGMLLPNGTREPLDVKPGDHVVIFPQTWQATLSDGTFLVDITGVDAIL